MIQLIEVQDNKFYMNIYNTPCVFIPMELFTYNSIIPVPAKVKGSTLGWYVNRKWVSYNQVVKATRKKI